MSSTRDSERRASLDPVYSVQRAAELLPLHDTDARRWLEEQGLVRWLDGRPVVVWSLVTEKLRRTDEPQPKTPRDATTRLPRVEL